ncbi:nuclear transport factor 2 family protein [Crossiella cryophila]|uniref:Ketosteroid isomerase-like protein n=1 Tax=Crossiella cryophila TaxID=43355 RepID=A0A7W7CFG4_9PSEU|nr:nuclear transport factor 2 family protein [Crossiella cryophila]MBB4680145.1 ketosteroid isomerase-like protein [Crossiella cryophila]
MSEERKVAEVLARYVRATDDRNGPAQGALFTEDAVVEVMVRSGKGYEKVGEPLIGSAGVAWAVENLMAPHPPGGSSHHMTADHIIEVNGDIAHLSAQVIHFSVREEIRPVESAYYDTDLRKIDGEWKITHHCVLLDRPMVGPDA